MHGNVSEAEFLQDISGVLAGLYLAAALVNFGAAYYWFTRRGAARSGARTQAIVVVRRRAVLLPAGAVGGEWRSESDELDLLSRSVPSAG